MDNTSVFNQDFLDVVKDKLDELCADGVAVTRSALCEALELDGSLEPIVGAVVSMGLIPEYDTRKGRGIGKVGMTAAKKQQAVPELTDEFLELLRATLEDVVPQDGSCVTRKEVAEAMNEGGAKAENMISQALRRDDLSDQFKARPGRFGGICRVGVEDAQEDSKGVTDVSDTDDTDVTEDLSAADTDDIMPDVAYPASDSPLARHHARLRADATGNPDSTDTLK
jgi:hypothetical protein